MQENKNKKIGPSPSQFFVGPRPKKLFKPPKKKKENEKKTKNGPPTIFRTPSKNKDYGTKNINYLKKKNHDTHTYFCSLLTTDNTRVPGQ